MLGLTARQEELLDFIKSCERSPSFEEMRAALGLSSKSAVHSLVTGLEERGFIERRPGRDRSIKVVDFSSVKHASTEAILNELRLRGYSVRFEFIPETGA